MKTTIAVLLSFLSMFAFGAIWNAALFENTYLSLSPEIVRPLDEFNFGIIFATNAIFTFLIYLIGKYYFDSFQFKSVWIGGLMGFFTVQPALTNIYAKWDVAYSYIVLDTIYTTLLGAIGMLVFCRLYFRRSNTIVSR